MKSHLFTIYLPIKLIGRYKLVHLFTPIGRQSKNVSCFPVLPQGKFRCKKCCS